MSRVRIELAERSYDIHIGAGVLGHAGELVFKVVKGRTAAIVTNPRIGNLYARGLVESLEASGITASAVTIPAGESHKTLRTVARIYEELLDRRIDRGGMVIGLGGGVVGDLAGFAAATYLRGIDFIQVPTSLLAQVDAGVGGKTGANLSRGKNLVGAFHQPRLVLIDTSVLSTLPRREFRAGLAEVIKHGIIRDRAYLEFVSQKLDDIMRLNPAALDRVITVSCEIKADVVRQDEREAGLRRILNFGHTTAHAVERLTGYNRFKHGEAVAMGMVTAALVSRERGAASSDVREIVEVIKAAGLPHKLPPELSVSDVVTAMGYDKKVSQGRLHAVLIRSIGDAYVADDTPPELWEKALEEQSSL